MNKLLVASLVTVGMAISGMSIAHTDHELVEVRLVDNIDDDRGYCIDIAGGRGTDAPLDRGLQAHNCYDYTGGLLEDQSFDVELIKEGQFKITYFDVCMTAASLTEGAALELAACDSSDVQTFALQTNGQLVATAKPELCVTVSATEKKEGRGGSPKHVMRPISLEACSADNGKYQMWKTYSL